MRKLKSQHRQVNKVLRNTVIILSRIVVLAIIIFLIWSQNNLVLTRNFVYADTDLPKSLVGYKILHVSDMCNTSNDVYSMAKLSDADIIVLSGGYSDVDGNSSKTVATVNKLCKLAPVYYICNTSDKEDYLNETEAINITDKLIEIESDVEDVDTFVKEVYGKGIVEKASKGDEEAIQYLQYIKDELDNAKYSTIKLCGIDNMIDLPNSDIKCKSLSLTGANKDDLVIMVNGNLSNIDTLCKTNIDIMFIGGTFGKITDKCSYSKGAFSCLGARLFVSGGCGNYTGKRICNLPEIQLITLSDGTIKQSSPIENLLDLFIDDVGTIYDNDGGFNEYTYKYRNKQ